MRYPRWFWAAFGAPGLIWLGLLFLVPLYVILAVSMGTVDPIFLSPVPVWNPLDWSTGAFEQIWEGLGPGEPF